MMRKAAAADRSKVIAIGVAQEYQRVFNGIKDKTATGAVWFSYNRAERRVTCYYFYVWDEGFGPAFIKICQGSSVVAGHEGCTNVAGRLWLLSTWSRSLPIMGGRLSPGY